MFGLGTDEIGDPVDLSHADKGTLDTLHLDTSIIKHVSPTDEVLGSVRIKNCS